MPDKVMSPPKMKRKGGTVKSASSGLFTGPSNETSNLNYYNRSGKGKKK